MTQVNLPIFAPQLPVDMAEETANTLAISYLTLALRTSLYARLFGVLTGAEEGSTEYETFIINSCLRNAIWTALYQVQSETERQIKYNLTARYHQDEIPILDTGKYQTKWPAVAQLHIKREWSAIEDYDNLAVNPYIVENAPVVEASFPEVRVNRTLVRNPNNVFLREDGTNRALDFITDPADYPKIDGDDWVFLIDTNKVVWTPGTQVNVQHRQYLTMTITPPVGLPAGANVEFVYPGTNQIVPQAKPYEDLAGGQRRYWFYIYTLVDPEFTERVVNLERGEFYKLYTHLELKYWQDVDAPALVRIYEGEKFKEYEYTPNPVDPTVQQAFFFDLVDQEHGIYHLTLNECFTEWCRSTIPDWDSHAPTSIRVVVHYKTDPVYLKDKYLYQIAEILDAMMYKVAAELPTTDCDCKVTQGFIAQNQIPYYDQYANPLTGTEIIKFRYGQLTGQIRYGETMGRVLHYSKPIRLSTKG